MDQWAEQVWFYVTLIIACFILATVGLFAGLGRQIQAAVYQDQAVVAQAQAERRFLGYDNKTLNYSDVLRLAVEQSEDGIVVLLKNGSSYRTVVPATATFATWVTNNSAAITAASFTTTVATYGTVLTSKDITTTVDTALQGLFTTSYASNSYKSVLIYSGNRVVGIAVSKI